MNSNLTCFGGQRLNKVHTVKGSVHEAGWTMTEKWTVQRLVFICSTLICMPTHTARS